MYAQPHKGHCVEEYLQPEHNIRTPHDAEVDPIAGMAVLGASEQYRRPLIDQSPLMQLPADVEPTMMGDSCASASCACTWTCPERLAGPPQNLGCGALRICRAASPP